MFGLYGGPAQLCDGLTRREILRVGGLSALGFFLPELIGSGRLAGAVRSTALAADPMAASVAGTRSTPRAKACILTFLFGGPSHLDTWDPKPDAPAGIRGEFKAIPTRVPGILLSEHWPLMAAQMGRWALVRSLHHEHPGHSYGHYYMLTGHPHPRRDIDAPPRPDDMPSMAALVSRFRGRTSSLPPAVTLPRWNKFEDLPSEYAGERAGILGAAYDPWLVNSDPSSPGFQVPGLELPADVSLARLDERRSLLEALDRHVARFADRAAGQKISADYARALTLISSPAARRAFDLSREDPRLRDRYGRHPFGQGLLLACRLVEAGVSLVTVNWHRDGSDVKSPFWDTHKNNFNVLKGRLVPPVDQGLTALVDDLQSRGLLESTLVVCMGEFGRSPRIGRVVQNAATDSSGRDHWAGCYSAILAGGGVRGGQAYGASDPIGAYPAADPVTPADFAATLLHSLGIDPAQQIADQLGRPFRITHGQPITPLLS